MNVIQSLINYDPIAFAHSCGFYPDDVWQTDFLRSNYHRNMLMVHRQGGKSTTTAFKAYHLSKVEIGLGIIISPSERQSKELLLKLKQFISDDPTFIGFDKQTETEVRFSNGSRIVALPANEATIRGYSKPKWIIIDEAALCPDNVYKGSVRPMMATHKECKLYLISTPHGKRGFFYNEWVSPSEWKRWKIQAPMCPRIDDDFLQEERVSLGDKWFNQEYMCEFLNVNENIFDMDLINASFGDVETLQKEDKSVINFGGVLTLEEQYGCSIMSLY